MRVVAGVLVDEHKRVCVARRPFETSYGGCWEFPGGKVEKEIDGGREDRALARELTEELGIVPRRTSKACTVSFGACDVSVYIVHDWKGTPKCLEGQPCVEWVVLEALKTRPLTPGTRAAIPVLHKTIFHCLPNN